MEPVHKHDFKAVSLIKNLYQCVGCGKTGYKFGKMFRVDVKQRTAMADAARKALEQSRAAGAR